MSNDIILAPQPSGKAKITHEQINDIMFDYYNLKCISCKPLNGYDDLNFLVSAQHPCNTLYVMKVINSLDSKNSSLLDAQTKIVQHLKPLLGEIQCPVPVQTVSGSYLANGVPLDDSQPHAVRLLRFIPGTILAHVSSTSLDYSLFRHVGCVAGRIDVALQSFQHPVFHYHRPAWMLDAAPQVAKFLFAVSDGRKRNTVIQVLQQFQEQVLDNIDLRLERGIIHGDLNEQNLIVKHCENKQWKVAAVLDFGDCHWGAYLFELAIAMTYMMLHVKDLRVGSFVLDGYQSVRPIPAKHLKYLKICVEARLCQSVVMGEYTHLQDPANNYVLTAVKPGWELLTLMRTKTDEELLNLWLTTDVKV